MAQQPEITKFFHAKRKMPRESGSKESRMCISVRPMSELCTTPEKLGRHARAPQPSPNPRNDTISLLSSDEDQENLSSASRGAPPGSPAKKYSPGPFTPAKTPKAHSSLQGNSEVSPKKKFYSPTKKRSVKLSPAKPRASNSFVVTPKKLFCEDDDVYAKACAGQDDKTKFLLHIVHQFVKDESQAYLLGAEELQLLQRYMRARTSGARLVCRLYWRMERWYRSAELLHIAKDTDADSCMLRELLDGGFLVQGSSHHMELEDYINGLLKSEVLRNICKFLKLKSQSKKDSIHLLRSYCKSSNNIASYFNVNRNRKNPNNNKNRVMKMLREAAGECYRLSELCRGALVRLYKLSYLGMPSSVLRDKQLELQLINVKSGREAFPVDPHLELDKPSLVFPTRDSFESYMTAHYIYEDFLQTTDSTKKISIVKQAHNLFKDLPIEEYSSLPPWLRKFTPAYLYMKIIEEGLPELKKGKDAGLCRLAVDMLGALLAQDVLRPHKRADWYDEMALLLHNYLHLPDRAAAVLLEALSSDLPEEAKDVLRPRAKKLGAQKNIELDRRLRDVLLAHAASNYVLESSLPAAHFYKQAMENITKGKLLFESRTEDGRTVCSVENVAISSYLETGEYTQGRHWEGRIITTLFFLLFWDIIYSKPKDAKGIFLCHYQRYPLDLLYDSFYQSRRRAIDDRLSCIEASSADEIAQMMCVTWSSRPEGEQSGIARELGWEAVAQVARCLGAAPLAALCRRLAHNYHHACSGFPDLTLWHPATGKIKFAEVKSDSDKPSMKQIQWLQYLLASGVEAELCYVGVRGPHAAAARASAVDLLREM